MRTRRFLPLCALVLAACSSPKHDNTEPGVFNQDRLSQLSAERCQNGQALTELEMRPSLDIEDMNDGVEMYGFSQGSGRCAVDKEIHNRFPIGFDVAYFDLTATPSCIPNGSFWDAKSVTVSSPYAFFDFVSLDDDGARISLSATRDIAATYARDYAGLRRFACQAPKPSKPATFR